MHDPHYHKTQKSKIPLWELEKKYNIDARVDKMAKYLWGFVLAFTLQYKLLPRTSRTSLIAYGLMKKSLIAMLGMLKKQLVDYFPNSPHMHDHFEAAVQADEDE